ncbi:DUF3800 domain-containing protein [Dyella sp. LX-66]|uniref:DUF3800 domain-containing protein n=1 Tax=unclassified Dyella TaxID=2634549 RepID=UPI001BE11202|nr:MULTISPECIES: DUF3800 domain-containing protein [unclassified Dyella]MBT2119243.1 DUF3800 domain-containing protein [Dyella sp. LX-1]MBT2141614.1 DUF3800 domain-containing protein [Dyella sp. LX-66]
MKRSDAPEWAYLKFLERLKALNGVAVAVATDSSLNRQVADHRRLQAKKIRDYVPKMNHEQGKKMISELADSMMALSDQNYVELLCRTYLAWEVVKISTLYFSQRVPETLGAFSWRFDQKNLTRNRFEATFEAIAPAFMQTMSMRNALIQLKEADYSAFERFSWEGEEPYWLPPLKPDHDRVNAVKIWREDLDFVDSKKVLGVQAADLIASGLYGVLRGNLHQNDKAAHLLGSLMTSLGGYIEPLPLIALGPADGKQEDSWLSRLTGHVVAEIRRAARPVLNS